MKGPKETKHGSRRKTTNANRSNKRKPSEKKKFGAKTSKMGAKSKSGREHGWDQSDSSQRNISSYFSIDARPILLL